MATTYEDDFVASRLPTAQNLARVTSVPGFEYPTAMNVCLELLDRTVAEQGASRTAVVSRDGTWSYGELLHNVQRTADFLRHLGIRPGNRVLLMAPNRGWLLVAWLATLRIGAIAVTVPAALRSLEINEISTIAEPQLAIVDPSCADEWHDMSGFGGSRISIDDVSDAVDDMKLQLDESVPHVPLAEDIAILAFTSGSTGIPKATAHSHRDLMAVADTFSGNVLQPSALDVFGGSPPLAFTFGLGALLLFPLRAGAMTVLLDKASPRDLLEAVEEYGVSILFTSPTAYRFMLRDTLGDRLGSVRICVSAGEDLSAATWSEWFDRTGLRIVNGIGSTEMLHIFMSTRPETARPGILGIPVPGYEACVVDSSMAPVPDGEVGHLAVVGPTGCKYLDPKQQQHYVRGGWNVTGDLVIRNPDGTFSFHSRSDDIIVSSGYNIAGPEVEAALLTHPGVAEVAVVGVPDAERGSLVKAFVVPVEGLDQSAQTIRDLQDHVKQTIAPYKYPRAIEFVASLPKTSTGKIQRSRLPRV